MDPGRPSGTSSSASKSKFPQIRHLQNARHVCLCSSSSYKDEENQTKVKTPRLLDSSSSAIFTIANIDDLLTNILIYLPPKSLLRFQTVSKKWLSIISNPTFQCLHSRFFPTTTTSSAAAADGLFLFRKIRRTRELNFISFHEKEVKSMATITSRLGNFLDGEIKGLHSCNGLLCIEFNFSYDRREFIVYNPTTNQHRLIPRCKPGVERCKLLTMNIAFDPVKSDHYKLVCVCADQFENEFRFMLYSSETGVWRETAETFEMFGEPYYFERGVLWNGDLHWVSEWSGSLCFDLNNECLRPVIPNPTTPSVYWWDVCYFGESGGHLYFIGLNRPQEMLFNVFSLKRDYSQWVVKYCIDVAPLTTLYPSMVVEGYESLDEKGFDFHMPCFLVDEEERKEKLVISLEGKVISYDIHDFTVKELAEVDPGEVSHSFRDALKYNWKEAYLHIETLGRI